MSGHWIRRALLAPLSIALSATAVHAQTAVLGPSLVALAPGGGELPGALRTDVLGVVPDDALGLVVASQIKQTKGTVEKVLRKLQIPFDADGEYRKATDFLDQLPGWNDEGLHAFAFFAGEDGDDPEAAVFIPVSNFKQFAAALGAEVDGEKSVEFKIEDGPDGLIAPKGSFAVLVEKSNDALLSRILTAKSSVAAQCEPLRPWIAKHQVTGIVLPGALKRTMDEVIGGLEKVQESFPADNAQVEMVKSAFGIYVDLAKLVREEVTTVAVGSTLDEEHGLGIGVQTLVKPGGRVAASLGTVEPLAAAPLAGLPDGNYFMAAAAVVPQQWMKSLMKFSMSMLKGLPNEGVEGLTPEQLQEIVAASTSAMDGIRSFAFSADFAGKNLFSGTYGIYRVVDSAAMLDRQEASMKKLQEISKGKKIPGLPEQSVERMKVAGLDTIKMTTDVATVFEQAAAGQPIQMKAMFEQLFGNGGKMTAYFAALNKETALFTYDADAVEALAEDVKAGKPGLAADLNLKATASLLPTTSHAVGYLNLSGLIEMMKKFMGAAMAAQGAGGFLPPIPPFPETAPLGAAARLNPGSIEMRFVVPMQTAEAVRDYVQQVMAAFGAGLR